MFTGSSAVGAQIAGRCGQRLVGCSMELGGKNPMIVADDADAGRAAEVAVRACFDNAGQLCVGIERIYVMAGAYEAFLERFLSRLGRLRMSAAVGWGSDYGSLIGAEQLASGHQRCRTTRSPRARRCSRARTRCPRSARTSTPRRSCTDVTPDMSCYGAETFGPVVAVQRVDSEQEAIDAGQRLRLRAQRVGPQRRRQAGCAGSHARSAPARSTSTRPTRRASAPPRAPMGGMGLSGLGRRNGDYGLTTVHRGADDRRPARHRARHAVRHGARGLGCRGHPWHPGSEAGGAQVALDRVGARWRTRVPSAVSSLPWVNPSVSRGQPAACGPGLRLRLRRAGDRVRLRRIRDGAAADREGLPRRRPGGRPALRRRRLRQDLAGTCATSCGRPELGCYGIQRIHLLRRRRWCARRRRCRRRVAGLRQHALRAARTPSSRIRSGRDITDWARRARARTTTRPSGCSASSRTRR